MSRSHNSGESSLKLVVFSAGLDPDAWPPYDKYIGQTNTFSLVWRDAAQTIADLYVHDEFTQGGRLIASTDGTGGGGGLPGAPQLWTAGTPIPEGWTQVGTLGDYLVIEQGGGPEPGAAPVVTARPTWPSEMAPGQDVQVPIGAATGDPAPTFRFTLTLDGDDVTAIAYVNEGFLVFEVPEGDELETRTWWENSAGISAIDEVTHTITNAPVLVIDYTRAMHYFDENTAIEGTPENVTAVNTSGIIALRNIATGTGTGGIMEDDGLETANGIWYQSQAYVAGTEICGDGLFYVVCATIDRRDGIDGQLVSGAGAGVRFLDVGGQLRAAASATSNLNVNLGPTPYGTRFVVAGRIDDILDLFETISPSEATTSGVFVNNDPSPTRFNFARNLVGKIHRIAVFGRPEGGEWPYTMEQVYADFQQGV